MHEFNPSGEINKIDTQELFQKGKQKQTTLAILAEQVFTYIL